jgi:DNA repair protein RecN (Recombination protein N)
MLEELTVQNYALIDRLSVHFRPGFNVLTGETGAGKSILVGALGVLLGMKADKESIRSGTEELQVAGIIQVEGNPEALKWLDDHGIEPEDGTVIVRRSVRQNGRGAIYIQSHPATRAELYELTSLLFDFHGQHEHQSLLDLENHRKLLDRYAGLEEQTGTYHDRYQRLIRLRERFSGLQASERERFREIDLLKFSIQEIREADLKPGEEVELEREHQILANHERLFQRLNEAHTSTAESRGGALAALRQVRQAMEEILQIDPQVARLSRQLDDAFFELEDFAESIRQYKSRTDFDPHRLEIVEERIATIHRLQKKYGDTTQEILRYCLEAEQNVSSLENWEEEKEGLKEEIAALEKEIRARAVELSEARNRFARVLSQKIEEELRQLGMPKVQFQVLVEDRLGESGKPVFTAWGKDRIEFLISPNLGEPFKRLIQIASGGEMSRVMLAIKSVLAESDHIRCLIFDEVDAGIGGEVGLAVGGRLRALSRLKQILCITHLATIAAQADNHMRVEKVSQDGRTVTRLEAVTGDVRREELARMLSGDRTGEVSLKHADELLKRYSA